MKPEEWRPSAVLRKRRTSFFTMIEVSCLLGIMLFILVLFMLPAFLPPPHMHQVDLALSDHPKAMPGALKEGALQVMVTRDGSVYLNDSRVKNGDLASLLQQGVKEGSEKKVYVKAGARAKYGEVKAVLDQIRLAGIENVSFITWQRDSKTAH